MKRQAWSRAMEPVRVCTTGSNSNGPSLPQTAVCFSLSSPLATPPHALQSHTFAPLDPRPPGSGHWPLVPLFKRPLFWPHRTRSKNYPHSRSCSPFEARKPGKKESQWACQESNLESSGTWPDARSITPQALRSWQRGSFIGPNTKRDRGHPNCPIFQKNTPRLVDHCLWTPLAHFHRKNFLQAATATLAALEQQVKLKFLPPFSSWLQPVTSL